MKPDDKVRMIKARPELVRTLDVIQLLPFLKRPGMFNQQEEAAILSDPRRRERIEIFLKMLEAKSDETYQLFCEVLAEKFPHLYLMLSDWEDDGVNSLPIASHAKLDDEWGVLHRYRPYLIAQIDAAKLTPQLRQHQVITEEQERLILADPDCERRTETFLDLLETKPVGEYEKFVEIVGEMYPHVYLALTGADDEW